MNLPGTNAAIFYGEDGYSTAERDIMGRHSAGEGFLAGLLRHGSLERLILHCDNDEEARRCEEKHAELLAGRPVARIVLGRPQDLRTAGTLYLPDPNLASQAWARRRSAGQREWSLCGVTHTIATKRAVGFIQAALTAPVQPWDALVCTSRAVRAAVDELLGAEQEYLRARFGGAGFVLPQLPVIPLGVDCARYAESAAAREEQRRALEAGPETCVVLFFGRLSYHAKAHHGPLYRMLERAARSTGKPVLLALAGWFPNEVTRGIFAEDAARLCPSVRVVFLDGRKPEVRQGVWQAADIFCSLSDNLQETFGLTPIEAMAAGLPLVVSDWDGYRDTVRDGSEGFLVPTRTPAVNTSADLAARFAQGIDNYDGYCAYSSQFVEVELAAGERAFQALIADEGLRRRMGAAGRRRAEEHYDWSVVVRRYQALWDELALLRRSAAESAPRAPGSTGDPAHLDPFEIYAGYPARRLTATTTIRLASAEAESALDELWSGKSTRPGRFHELLPQRAQLSALLREIGEKPGLSVSDLAGRLAAADRRKSLRALVWMAKHGLLALD